jgi:monothiol glutaredoxin
MLDEAVRQRIDGLVASDKIVLFMKGDRIQPQCGFSASVVEILNELAPSYTTVDVLADPEIRQGVKDYSSWPTIPQLYVGGEFVGGCDIIRELYGAGELHARLGVPAPERRVPTLHVSEQAAAFLRRAVAEAPAGQALHLRIGPSFQNRAYLGPPEAGEIEAGVAGVTFLLDLPTAQRAEGLRIDYAETPHGHDLTIENPNAPQPVQPMTAQELKRRLDAGEPVELFDVRTPEERELARIPGARLLDAEAAADIRELPQDTLLVFHCHKGGRSQQAAEHFRGLGFRNVHNLVGGIDAWSQQVDPSVPRY